jgi:Transposase DDE domain group 1
MTTPCTPATFTFQTLGNREVIGSFDGGTITSDGGSLLLGEVEAKTHILHQFAACFTDHRDPDLIEHTAYQLIAQRVFGLALGYEDLNDHDTLRLDPLLATVVGKNDPTGADRLRLQDQGKPLAGKSTLNRLELTPEDATPQSRYKKIVAQVAALDRFFADIFLQSYLLPPQTIFLDLDATDDPLHGHQEGRFFHGYYQEYCYLPLYIFCGDQLLLARLRTADNDASWGTVTELEWLIPYIRARWPQVRIILRADSGFCREEIMSWCEEHNVDYLFGLAQNSRLVEALTPALADALVRYLHTGVAARVFADFVYQTRDSWSRARRVVGKAEYLPKGPNPRFVVTTLPSEERADQLLYESDYCARGDMENRIKEQQLMLFADRTSTATLRANQLRLWFSSVAYLLMDALRRVGLTPTAASPVTLVAPLTPIEPNPETPATTLTPAESNPAASATTLTPIEPSPVTPVVTLTSTNLPLVTTPTLLASPTNLTTLAAMDPPSITSPKTSVPANSPQPQCQTLRLQLLKMGALVRVTVRKIWVSFSSAWPYQKLFARVWSQWQQAPATFPVPMRC